MKYWVYINEEVLPQPYEAGELYTIKGFDGQTLICPEVAAEGEEQQWYTADELINYTASRPKNLAEAVAAASAQAEQGDMPQAEQAQTAGASQEEPSYMPSDEQEVYDASDDYNPEPLPDSYGKEQAPSPLMQDNSGINNILLEKIGLLLTEISGLKENISALNEKTSELAQRIEKAETGKKNSPIVKDYAALKAFQNKEDAPLNENEIPEEQISPEENDPEKMPIITADPEDILESAMENTMRLKNVSDTVAPVAFDLTSKETIQITEDEKDKPSQEKPEEKQSQEPLQEQKESNTEQKEAKEEIPSQEEVAQYIEEEPAAEETPAEQEEPVQEETSEQEAPSGSEEDVESVKITSVGTQEEEEILKTFAQEKRDEQEEAASAVEGIAELEEEPSAEPAFEQLPAAQEQFEEPAQAAEPQQEDMPQEQPYAEENQEQYFQSQQEENEPQEQSQQEEDALSALTTPPEGEASQETAQVEGLDDKFLKTFSSSIDEISLDQPTSIISDYVPPAVASDSPLYDEDSSAQPKVQGLEDLKNQPPVQEDVRQVKRIKPAAIKTVPMVAAGTPIGVEDNPSNMEEAVTELAHTSPVMKGIKAFGLMIVLLCVVLGFVYVLAVMGILSKDLSPVHYMLDKFTGSKVEETLDLQETTAPAAAPAQAASSDEDFGDDFDEDAKADDILNSVKNYQFSDGSTLELRIKTMHGDNADKIQWSAEPSVNPSYYQVVITLPPNREGYNVTYRFNYDTEKKELIPTTSESNNIMNMNMPSQASSKK